MPAVRLEEVLARLEERGSRVKQNRGGFEAFCPVHGDTKHRHLYLRRGDRTELLMHCFKGCEYHLILEALGFDPTVARAPSSNGQDGQITVYSYYTAENDLLFQECRYVRQTETGSEKTVFMRRPNGRGRWINDIQGITRIPFRLPQLLRAGMDEIVLLTEGPKCAQFLADQGYPVTTTANGAGAFKNTPDLPYYLAGRMVAILPDYDKAGVQHAKDLRQWLLLSGYQIQPRIVPLPGLPTVDKDGEDIYDWLTTRRHTFDDLKAQVETLFAPDRLKRTVAAQARPENARPPASLDPLAYLGVAGRVVDTLAPFSEAELAPLLVNFLLAWGCLVGRSPYARVGATRHYLNEFALLVGPTGGGKGSSWSPVRWLLSHVDPAFGKDGIVKGLSSGEGLVALVRDRKVRLEQGKGKFDEPEEVIEDEGVADKRKLVVEEEFLNVLAVMRRSGNTLSARIREAWDDGRLEITTKERVIATDAHISLIGHITPEEMRERLSEEDAGNGFGNRFLLVAAKPRQLIPHGSILPNVSPLVSELHMLFAEAKGMTEIARTPAACYIWEAIYPDLKRGRGGLFGKMVERRAPHILRLAANYATLTGRGAVDVEELLAGIALWTFCEQGAWWLFGAKVGVSLADRLFTVIQERPGGIGRTALLEVTGTTYQHREVDQALTVLLSRGKIYGERRRGAGGRDMEMFFADQQIVIDESEVYLKKARAAWDTLQTHRGPPPGWSPAEVLELEEKES